MSKWMDGAGILQRMVQHDEAYQADEKQVKYSDDRVRLAIIHSRQDIVLLTSLLNSANETLDKILTTLHMIGWIIGWGAACFVLKEIMPYQPQIQSYLQGLLK